MEALLLCLAHKQGSLGLMTLSGCGQVQELAAGAQSTGLCRMQVLTQAGAYVKEEVVRALIVLVTNAPDLHGYCARAMYRALRRDLAAADPALVTASTWVIGGCRALR